MENHLKFSRLLVLMLSFQALFFISASATRDFHSRGEPREALVVQDMLSSGNIILAEGYGGVVPSKPPLFHWLGAAASLPLGHVSELSTRFPSILAACLIALICYFLFAPESSKETALLTTLILASSNEWLRTASTARVDMLLTAALMAAFFSLYRWSERAFTGYPWLLLLSAISAILCKGPVGVILPGLVYLAICVLDKINLAKIVKNGFVVFAPALVIASLWYGAAYLSRPQEFLDKVYYENVARFLSMQDDEPHKASAFKLYGLVFLGFLPWTFLFLTIGVKRIKLKEFRINFPGLLYLKLWWRTRARIDKFSIIIVFVTLLFYSIPKGKRSAYVLPIHPFIAFWLARLCIEEARSLSSRVFIRAAYTVVVLSLVLLAILSSIVVMPGIMLLSHSPLSSAALLIEIQQTIRLFIFNSIGSLGLTVLLGLLLILVSMTVLLLAKKESGLPWFLLVIFTLYLFAQLVAVPAVVNPISPKVFAAQIVSKVPETAQLLSFGEEFYGLSFYTKRKIKRSEEFGFPSGSVVIVSEEDFGKLKDGLPPGTALEPLDWSNQSVMSFGKRLGLFRIVVS